MTQAPGRRPRYQGTNPRRFHEKYKELDPARYPADVQKVLASGKTPAGTHRPIMVDEVLRCLRPTPGEVAVDCTLGGGGHARAVLERLQPGGRLIGLDLDPFELPRTEAQLRAAGFGPDTFSAHHANFAGLPQVLATEGLAAADLILVDLGVSSMQLDNPDRGFSYKDLKQKPVETTHALESVVRLGLGSAYVNLTKADIKLSVRRTFQALRIAVNDELSVLDSLLRSLPQYLAPGGRVAILTFHSGEDRRVKKAFQAGHRAGVYSAVAPDVIRSTTEELRANRRAQAAKLRWAVRATQAK